MRTVLALALLAALSSTAAYADTGPLVNRVIVNQALEQQLQNQLNVQQIQLQTQQDLMRANLQTQLQQQSMQLQYILLEQQLELLKIQQRTHACVNRSSAARKTRGSYRCL